MVAPDESFGAASMFMQYAHCHACRENKVLTARADGAAWKMALSMEVTVSGLAFCRKGQDLTPLLSEIGDIKTNQLPDKRRANGNCACSDRDLQAKYPDLQEIGKATQGKAQCRSIPHFAKYQYYSKTANRCDIVPGKKCWQVRSTQ